MNAFPHLLPLALLVAAPAFAQNAKLNAIMKPDTLGTQIGWLEKQIGPAKNIWKSSRTYDVGGCTVSLKISSDQSVQSIGLESISPKCSFDTTAIGLSGPAHKLRLKDIAAGGYRWKAEETCLGNCGNLVDPEFSMVSETPRLNNFVQHRAILADAQASRQITAFSGAVHAAATPTDDYGLFYRYVGSAISQEKYNQLWMKYFGEQRLKAIYFGYELFD